MIAIMIVILLAPSLSHAFTLHWDADPNDPRDGFRLYRHAGLCKDEVKKWKVVNEYPPDDYQGKTATPKKGLIRCYVMRAFRGDLESGDSNLLQWPKVMK